MQIDYNILIAYGGIAKKFEKGEYVFVEDSMPHFYYQVIEGQVKVYYSNSDGRELTQGIFSRGQSFGEPPLILNKPYPNFAQALTQCVLIKLGKDNLFKILKDFPEMSHRLFLTFAERMYDMATFSAIMIKPRPQEKLELFLRSLRKEIYSEKRLLVPFTRQQIANFTGLRVETVIRELKKMSKENKVSIINKKLYY